MARTAIYGAATLWIYVSRRARDPTRIGYRRSAAFKRQEAAAYHPPLWRNRLARSAVNRKVGGSNPPRGVKFLV